MVIIHKDLNILAKALANTDFDFYACAVTPWHLINIEAYLSEIAKSKKIKGILSIGKHARSGYVLKTEDIIPIDNVDFEICKQDDRLEQILKKHSDINCQKPLYIISPLDYQYELGRSVQNYGRKEVFLIRTDEGILEYFDNNYRKLTRERDGLPKRPFIKAAMDWIILKASMRHWDRIHRVDRYMMRKNEVGRYMPQQNVVDSVRKFLQYSSQPIQHKKEAYALFLSFVWEEDSMWDISEYKMILKMLQKILTSNGIRLYVKTHPRERMLDKYMEWGIPIFTSEKIALETLLANLEVKPIAMFGLDSTALINASMLGGCISISLKKLVSKEKTSEIMWAGLETFQKYFQGYVKFVDTPNDISRLLHLQNRA